MALIEHISVCLKGSRCYKDVNTVMRICEHVNIMGNVINGTIHNSSDFTRINIWNFSFTKQLLSCIVYCLSINKQKYILEYIHFHT